MAADGDADMELAVVLAKSEGRPSLSASHPRFLARCGEFGKSIVHVL